MNNKEISFMILTGAIGSVIATLAINLFTSIEIEKSFLISLSLLSIYLIFIVIKLKKKTVPTLLQHVGIAEILIENKPQLRDVISTSEHSIYFWGISAKRTTSTPELKKKLIEIGRKGGDIRFLLFNPESPHFKRKAEDEGDNYISWDQEINATIQRLKAIAKKHKINIKIKLYDHFPVWRAIITDKKIIYLNYFQTGKQGPQSPSIQLYDKTDSIFNPLYTNFMETWDHFSINV